VRLNGGSHARRCGRTDQQIAAEFEIEYGMPEAYAHDRRTWIDTTDPISVRYVNY